MESHRSTWGNVVEIKLDRFQNKGTAENQKCCADGGGDCAEPLKDACTFFTTLTLVMISCLRFRCKQCSEAAVREPSADGVEVIDEKIIAEGERELGWNLWTVEVENTHTGNSPHSH